MTLISGLLLNRLLLNLLIRSMEQFGRGGPDEKSISRKALLGGIGGALLLAIYPYISQIKELSLLHYSINQSPGYIAICIITFIIGIYICIQNKQPILGRILLLLFGIILSISVSLSFGFSSVLIYLLLTATSEELLKSAALKPIYPHLLSDLILFGICAGLGFAWLENIIYLITIIYTGGTSDGLIIARYFSAVPLHAVWTGMIGCLYIYIYKHHRFYALLGIVAIILCHSVYNYLLYLQTPLLTIPFILLSYVGLAWLILRVERVYIRDGLEKNTN